MASSGLRAESLASIAQRSTPSASPAAPMMRWWGWGDPNHQPSLSTSALAAVRDALGVEDLRSAPPVALERVRVEPSRLSDAAASALRRLLGERGLLLDRFQRILHAAGKGHLDLVRLRQGTPEGTPDAVLRPASEDQLKALLPLCARHSLAVVPFGGGTSVVGGLAPLSGGHEAVISLNLSGLCELRLDHESRIVSAGAGLRVATLERKLGSEGLTLGHFPQSFEYVSLGGCAATRSAGQASSGYGRFEDMVLGLRLLSPAGEIDTLPVPASAAGPDLRELIVGSEGTLGVISSLSLRLRCTAKAKRYEGYLFDGFEHGLQTLRTLAQEGPKPTVARLSEAQETELSLRLSGDGGISDKLTHAYLSARGGRERCLAILGFEGEPSEVEAASRRLRELARRLGALRLGRRAGEAWLQHRFSAPYLRDELLTHGVLVETLETATSWSRLEALRAGVTRALSSALASFGTPGLVGCHVSHVYDSGASLYFTFLAPRAEGREPEQWQAAKSAACEAILACGGTLSHHHGIGRDHAPWVGQELGADGVEALRAVKQRLDPHGIMNPGKLLPAL